MDSKAAVPILLPYDPEVLLAQIRIIIKEEITKMHQKGAERNIYSTNGLQYKPLYKITEVCAIFSVSRPTIYDWIKHGKLRPYKIRSRVYFLWNDIQAMLEIVAI